MRYYPTDNPSSRFYTNGIPREDCDGNMPNKRGYFGKKAGSGLHRKVLVLNVAHKLNCGVHTSEIPVIREIEQWVSGPVATFVLYTSSLRLDSIRGRQARDIIRGRATATVGQVSYWW